MRVSSLSQSRQERNALGVMVVTTLGIQGVMAFFLLLLLIGYFKLAGKQPPAMVQLESGQAIAMEPLDSKDRTPATIQRFTRDTLTALFSATGEIPVMRNDGPSEFQADPGVEIRHRNGTGKIPTISYLSAFGLSEEFRAEFLKKMAEQVPPDVFKGSAQVVFTVRDISVPEPVEGKIGIWKVNVIGSKVTFTEENPEGLPELFKKTVFIRAVLPPSVTSYSTEIEQQIAQIRRAGLEIFSIENYRSSDPSS